MLRSLRVQDHESHADSFFEFHPGLNVIQGTGNVGKSSVLRALELVAYNVWPGGENKKEEKNGPVRVGCPHCTVTVVTDRGAVSVKKGTKINEWSVTTGEQKKTLTSPGTDQLPEARDVIGFETRNIAGLSLRLNWATQNDLHFLISQIEGESASPSLVAAVLDELAGLSGCEELIRCLTSDKQTTSSLSNELQESIRKISEELTLYSSVDSDLITLMNAEAILSDVEAKQRRLLTAQKLSQEKTVAETRVLGAAKTIGGLPDTVSAGKTLERISDLMTTHKHGAYLVTKFTSAEKRVAACQTTIKQATDIARVDLLLSRVSSLLEQVNRVKKAMSSLRVAHDNNDRLKKTAHPDIAACDSLLLKLATAMLSHETLKKTRTQLTTASDRVSTLTRRRDNALKLEETARAQLVELVSKTTVCPITNSPFVSTCIQSLTEE